MTTATSLAKQRPKTHADLVTYWVTEKGITPWLSFRGPENKAIAFNVHVGAMLTNPGRFEVNVYGKDAGENVPVQTLNPKYHLEADNILGTSWVGSEGFTLTQAHHFAQLVIDAFWTRHQPQFIEPVPPYIANQLMYSKLWHMIARFVNTESVRVRGLKL